jgi:uncharacterized membrane protein
MAAVRERPKGRRSEARAFITGIARAFGGALIFALPMLMTMEMWHLGFYMERWRLAVLLLLLLPLLVGLSHYIGFETTFDWEDDLRDSLVAIAVGATAASPCSSRGCRSGRRSARSRCRRSRPASARCSRAASSARARTTASARRAAMAAS